MIKSLIIIVIFASGHLCRVVPDEVSIQDNTEERTVSEQTISSDEERKPDSSENSQILSKEATIEEEKTGTIEQIEEESKNANLEERSLKIRSTETETIEKMGIDEMDKTAIPEHSETSSRADADDGNGRKDDVQEMLRNLGESFSSGAETKSAEQDDSPANLRSGTIETETSERDDAAHIQIKEQRQASPEQSMEVENEARQGSENKDDSRSASPENQFNTPFDGESKSMDDTPEKAASLENSRSISDADDDNSKSANEETEDLFKTATDLVEPVLSATRRMLGQAFNIGTEETERSDSYEAAATRMAPQDEDSSASGHQVHNNYFGGSRSIQSQYPYTPLETRIASPFLPSPFSNERPTSHNLFPSLHAPISPQNEHSLISSPMTLENGLNMKPSRPFPKLEPLPALPPLHSLESIGRFKFPPLDHRFQPHQPEPSWKPDCLNCNNSPFQNYQQPFQRFQRLIPPLGNFKPLNNMFPMLRQASSEDSPHSVSSFSKSWSSSFQESPFTF